VFGRSVGGIAVKAEGIEGGDGVHASALKNGTGLTASSETGFSIQAYGPARFYNTVTAATFQGSGANLSELNPANLASPVPASKIDPVIVRRNAANAFTGAISAPSFSGNGAGLTSLNAGNLAAGTVADARLPANLARTNAVSNAFTGDATFGGTVRAAILEGSEGRPVGLAFSGRATIRAGRRSARVLMPGVQAADNVVATLQNPPGAGVAISHAKASAGKVDVFLSGPAAATTRVAFVVLAG
jgi:hypothetical protein